MHDDLCLNVGVMDEKHEEFLKILSNIKTCEAELFLPLFEVMIRHTKEHFAYEENLMHAYNFYDKKVHFDEHETMLAEMNYFYEKAKKIPAFGKSYINEYAYEKFKRHVLNVDSQLAMFLKERSIA
ncbi:MAG: hemerythrin family protein [Sulfurimonas sp.]|nr:hemerythrin family protein [Sulfurimonas sp.]